MTQQTFTFPSDPFATAVMEAPTGAPVAVLKSSQGGRWRVRTYSGSTYLLDLDARTLTRFRGTPIESPLQSDLTDRGGAVVNQALRRDGEPLPLLELSDVVLGEPMALTLTGLRDGVETSRTTTEVHQLTALDGSADYLAELTATTGGVWEVFAGGTLHVWDLDQRTYLRAPGPRSLSGEFGHDYRAQPITKVGAYPRVGAQSLVFFDDPDNALMELWRVSSTIRCIRRKTAATGRTTASDPS